MERLAPSVVAFVVILLLIFALCNASMRSEGPSLLEKAVYSLFPRIGQAVKEREIKWTIKEMRRQVELYALEHDYIYPPTLELLLLRENGKRSYVKALPVDPWGNPYVYKPGTDMTMADFQIWSSGPDGVPGNDDDSDGMVVLD